MRVAARVEAPRRAMCNVMYPRKKEESNRSRLISARPFRGHPARTRFSPLLGLWSRHKLSELCVLLQRSSLLILFLARFAVASSASANGPAGSHAVRQLVFAVARNLLFLQSSVEQVTRLRRVLFSPALPRCFAFRLD